MKKKHGINLAVLKGKEDYKVPIYTQGKYDSGRFFSICSIARFTSAFGIYVSSHQVQIEICKINQISEVFHVALLILFNSQVHADM